MEARFTDEEEAAIFEPGEHPPRERLDLLVAEVHQQPVGEDDVVLPFGGQL